MTQIKLRVLIAGAGDLGGRVARLLRSRGHAVSAIARHPRASDPELLAFDLTRPIEYRLPEVDWLVHCLSPAVRDEEAYRATYVDSLRHLLDALPGPVRVAFVSSTAVYGDAGGGWVDEATDCTPGGFNGQVLRAAEQLAASRDHHALLLRLGGIYGAGRDALLRRVISGEPIAAGPPPLYTNRIEIDDAAAAVAHLIGIDARGVHNIVDDAPAAQPDVLDWIADAMDRPRLARLPARGAGDNRRVRNARLRESGFKLQKPSYQAGYAAVVGAYLARIAE